jgi:FKBP-type peptidyl-prolyl cis-trans isomerase SlyD
MEMANQINGLGMTVADDVVVSLAYTLLLGDGEAIERTEEDDALQFIQGHGQIIPGLEDALYGMGVGEEKAVIVDPAEGYGEYNEDDMQVMPRSAFPADMELEIGTGLRLRDQDTDEVYTVYIAEVDGENVVLDFNHPLAGETLHFQVKVTGLRPATAEELAHGHVHEPGHVH